MDSSDSENMEILVSSDDDDHLMLTSEAEHALTDEMVEISPEKKIYMPSATEKISESVNYGSIFVALAENFVQVGDVLNWLNTVEVTNRTRIAYKGVCEYMSPNEQYLTNTYHFLVKKPEYTPIAIGYGFIPEIPDRNIEGVTNPIIAHICDEFIKFNGDINLRKLTTLILSGKGDAQYIRSRLVTCYKSRNFPHLRDISGHEYNIALVEADWIEKFRYNDNIAGLIIKRMEELEKEAPSYYTMVAYPKYFKVASKLYKDKLLNQLNREELSEFNVLFPNIIDIRILGYSDIGYKISLLGNDVAGYILGYPVQEMVPNDEQIHKTVKMLTEIGPDRYAEHIKEYNSKRGEPSLPVETIGSVIYPNSTDVLFEDINNYSPFDIIICQIGLHIHRFSRAEACNILETKKNPWNKEWLPPTVMSTIKARVEAAKEMGFPEARSIREMLDLIEKGTFFKRSDESQHEIFIIDGMRDPNTIGELIVDRMIREPNTLEMLNRYLTGQWAPLFSGGVPDTLIQRERLFSPGRAETIIERADTIIQRAGIFTRRRGDSGSEIISDENDENSGDEPREDIDDGNYMNINGYDLRINQEEIGDENFLFSPEREEEQE